MTGKQFRELKGKVVERIERIGDAVFVWFTDGSAIEPGGSRLLDIADGILPPAKIDPRSTSQQLRAKQSHG